MISPELTMLTYLAFIGVTFQIDLQRAVVQHFPVYRFSAVVLYAFYKLTEYF